MPAIGLQELIIILVILLLLFGAKKLPELARGIGKSMGELKKAREDLDREILLDPAGNEAPPADAKADGGDTRPAQHLPKPVR